MSLRPEVHFSSVFEHCSRNSDFQCFQANPLNRLNIHRKSIQDFMQNSQSRFLPYRQLKVLVDQGKKQPVWLTYENLFEKNVDNTKLTMDQCELVLLGIGPKSIIDRSTSPITSSDSTKIDHELLTKYLLASEPTPDDYIYFALSVPTDFADSLSGTYADLRSLLPHLCVVDAAICGQGRALLEWHASHRFCGKCGSAAVTFEGGMRRKCTKCDNIMYPRTDPVVITLVVHSDNEHVLLGRKQSFPPYVYTCLAGFLEPGESIPEACAREIWEESGVVIETNRTCYFNSQPWPFLGGQLMIGCYGHAVNETITLHDSELEDCRWFSRSEIADMIQRSRHITPDKNDRGLRIPPPLAIAHQLIYNWYSTKANA